MLLINNLRIIRVLLFLIPFLTGKQGLEAPIVPLLARVHEGKKLNHKSSTRMIDVVKGERKTLL